MNPFFNLTILLLSPWLLVVTVIAQTTNASSQEPPPVKPLVHQYDKPAPDSDLGWVNASIPLGNGYMGVSVFGGSGTERLQITENSRQSDRRRPLLLASSRWQRDV